MGGDTARAAIMYGIFGTAWALMQFLFSPVLGSLSDRFGRRPIILLSNFGLGLDYILMALAPNLRWLFLGRVISGITAASISTAGAYIADVTPPEQRAAKFGLLGAAFGAGFVVGPALGGLLGDISPRLPFWVAAGFSLTNGMYGLFVLPESLTTRAALAVLVAQGESRRRAQAPALASRAVGIHLGDVPQQPRARRAAERRRALHGLSLQLGYESSGSAAGGRRRVPDHRAGVPGGASREGDRRATDHPRRARGRRRSASRFRRWRRTARSTPRAWSSCRCGD